MSANNEVFERVFWQALNDLEQGEAQPIEHYLRLVPEEDRQELSGMLADVLLARGPASGLDTAAGPGYERAVAIVDEVLGSRGEAGVLPGALKAIRKARGIEPEGVVEQLAADFDVEGEEGRQALARNYHRLETGKLLGSKLSRRLLASLAAVFDIDPAEVLDAARPAAAPPALKSAPAMGRGAGGGAPPSRPSPERLPDLEVELVERLFHGGPDA
ncbi:MAG TPA: hypothetical protein VFU11_13060 [Solirubrobacterales bacterium]|nr:hypothetical protein [Solirubrobacterales bacterium]